VLASVGQPGLRVGQIAAAVKRPHSTVSRSLKQLEVGGYTDRENASVKIAVPGMDLVREDLRPVAEAVASIAASYQGLHSIGYRHLKNFSLIRDAAEQYRRNFNVIAESAQQYHSQIQQTFRIFAETGQALQKTYAGVTRLASISKDLHVIGQAMQVAVRRIEETFRTLRPFLI
jgi:methyl-accepting chemotaxis protein